MEIRAYSQDYVDDAQRHLGEMLDFALLTLGCSTIKFADMFMVSAASKQLESGNPKYLSGMNGCELVRLIFEESGLTVEAEDAIYLERSPEYWCGWALAFYQWYSSKKYSEIISVVPFDEILAMYPAFHEMDLMQFTDAMNNRLAERSSDTKLAQYRRNSNLSQTELSARSGVALRQIQLFEQKRRDINKTQAETLLRLCRALHCSMEDLLET